MISRYALLLCAATAALPAFAADTRPPAEFGADWDDPRTAEPKVVRPETRHCTVEIVRHGFADFETNDRHSPRRPTVPARGTRWCWTWRAA